MTSFKEKCIEFFGTDNFYEVLDLKSDATKKEIKKAYHKLSLLVHPDRVDESQKTIATEKFKVLGRIHSILQDEDKRKVYDDSGEFDEETDASFNWMDYWRAMFKKIELKDIQNHEKEYLGSVTELRDIKKAYIATKGNMDTMLELIPFSNCDNEPRYIEIVRKMVENGEVEEYDCFFNEPGSKKFRRHRRWDDERKVVDTIDFAELEKDIERNQRKRSNDFANFMNNLESKYGNSTKRKSITNEESKPRRSTRSSRK